MNGCFNSFIKFFIKFKVDVEVHHLQILINLLVNQGKILLNDLRFYSTIFEKIISEVVVGNILFLISK